MNRKQVVNYLKKNKGELSLKKFADTIGIDASNLYKTVNERPSPHTGKIPPFPLSKVEAAAEWIQARSPEQALNT